jgi:hypothetical protein
MRNIFFVVKLTSEFFDKKKFNKLKFEFCEEKKKKKEYAMTV